MISPGQTDLQVDVLKSTLTRTCVRTCDGWPNGFASRLASSCKSQKLVAFTHIQLTCSHVELRWVAKRWNIRRLAYELELDQSQPKSSQVNASGWPNETQVRWLALKCESIWPAGLMVVISIPAKRQAVSEVLQACSTSRKAILLGFHRSLYYQNK